MTHEMLVRFCNIDYDREIAIVPYLKEEEQSRIIGISDIIIDQNLQSQFAVLIHDAYQGKGLGRKLIDSLIGIAQERGLAQINGVVLTENTRMLKLLRREARLQNVKKSIWNHRRDIQTQIRCKNGGGVNAPPPFLRLIFTSTGDIRLSPWRPCVPRPLRG